VLGEFPQHDALIMAAAVADYRPITGHAEKISRAGTLIIECESTEDIIAAAGRIKRPDQKTIGFSLESRGDISRSREKLVRKNLDLIVYNPTDTMNSDCIESILIWPGGREESLPARAKSAFANVLMARIEAMFR
jgi:phosphopantothenoylcysteine decarboxylase/phosphopantothenate--cysteine ligase